MANDPVRAPRPAREDGEVMASIDDAGDAARLIIADISGNDAWISIPTRAAVSLAEWR